MPTTMSARAALSAASLALVLAVSGCTGAAPAPAPTGSSAQLPAPVIVELGSIDGTTVTVPLPNVIVLAAGDTSVSAWTADIDDPDVLSFTPGRDDGSATFNPGLTPLKVGDSGVTLTDGETGETVSFEVEVTQG